jgi:hypothetical protein
MIVGQKGVVEVTVEQPGSPVPQRALKLVLRGSKPAPMLMTRLEHLLGLPIGLAFGAAVWRFSRGRATV